MVHHFTNVLMVRDRIGLCYIKIHHPLLEHDLNLPQKEYVFQMENCISRNFGEVFIFKNFASNHENAKIAKLQKITVCTILYGIDVNAAGLNSCTFDKACKIVKVSSREYKFS